MSIFDDAFDKAKAAGGAVVDGAKTAGGAVGDVAADGARAVADHAGPVLKGAAVGLAFLAMPPVGKLALGALAGFVLDSEQNMRNEPFSAGAPGGRMPAARVGDQVLCPLCPTPATTILGPGSATLFFSNRPAARIGDRTSCGARIITGCATTLDGGKPVARCGDRTDHGGVVISGDASMLLSQATAGSLPTERFSAAQIASLLATYGALTPAERAIRALLLQRGARFADIENGSQFKVKVGDCAYEAWKDGAEPAGRTSHNDVMDDQYRRRGPGGIGVLFGTDKDDKKGDKSGRTRRVQFEHNHFDGSPYWPPNLVRNRDHVADYLGGKFVPGDGQYGPHGRSPHGDEDPIPLPDDRPRRR